MQCNNILFSDWGNNMTKLQTPSSNLLGVQTFQRFWWKILSKWLIQICHVFTLPYFGVMLVNQLKPWGLFYPVSLFSPFTPKLPTSLQQQMVVDFGFGQAAHKVRKWEKEIGAK